MIGGRKSWILFFIYLFLSLSAFSQGSDTIAASSDARSKNDLISFIPPVVFLTYGLVALNNPALEKVDRFVYNDMQEDFPRFSTKLDDYLRYAPVVAVYALNFAGVKGKNNFVDRTAMLLLTTAIVSSSVTILKESTHRLRPNGGSNTSFPSGHTATAFASAEFMYQEYGDISIWYGVGGYAAATATGILRVYNNAHWFSDIIAGAGVGILSTKLSYLVYPILKNAVFPKKTNNSLLLPTYTDGIPGLCFTKQF
ncbi:phosphatase PAP2 family protein [Pedobacter sp. HMF7647]|uniref:Phosphatase PAP2 family protein n=1 Tax=Hufsiella arboris TaxID=2695275 RepID=A0A7K1YBI4_9SPHI|nr:phosphatase PAP2 family protein [Hufsiella arboris]MXV51957.1 phosphatase PAP2 family protein [Hufsiella arboris]